MVLLFLLLVPLVLGIAGKAFFKHEITFKEFVIHEVVMVLLITGAYVLTGYIVFRSRTDDVEVWNGVVSRKWMAMEHCHHSYSCHCYPAKVGKVTTLQCSTCYRHDQDPHWFATSTSGDELFSQYGTPGDSEPARWQSIVIGEPTAVEHTYTNYLKGFPSAILRTRGLSAKYAGKLPRYPTVFDTYRVKRFLVSGLKLDSMDDLNHRLDLLNATVGPKKQVNVVIVLTSEQNAEYLEALREAWVNGKKNDVVVVLGAPDFPEISWAGVLSLSRGKSFDTELSTAVTALEHFSPDTFFRTVEATVQQRYVRRPMSEFASLRQAIRPPNWAIGMLLLVGVCSSLGLQHVLAREDIA